MVKLGIVAFSNNSGLGNQTKRLVDMLKPDRLLVIDSRGFSKNGQKHTEWYKGYDTIYTNPAIHNGFPSNFQIRLFLGGITHVLCCENPLNFYLFTGAAKRGIKTYVQSNYEFCDNLRLGSLPLPTKFLMPSYWKLEEMRERFGPDKVMYLPPPLNPDEFATVRTNNLNRQGSRRFLHIIGTLAAHDRNGTHDLLDAIKLAKEDFTVTIKSQHPLPAEYTTNVDPRVEFKIGDEPDVVNLYDGYDALILPRRYGGLCLSANEALMAGMPVIMPNISPNNKVLPRDWLVSATKKGEFMARVPIDIYQTDIAELAKKLDWLATSPIDKLAAVNIALKNYYDKVLLPKYQSLWT